MVSDFPNITLLVHGKARIRTLAAGPRGLHPNHYAVLSLLYNENGVYKAPNVGLVFQIKKLDHLTL